MKSIRKIVFRNLTDADFFNINKPPGTETGGGGQAYIDFPVRAIKVTEWEEFFDGIVGLNITKATQGPSWEFPVFSIGVNLDGITKQQLKIYQRRAASVSITSQKLISSKANRVDAWNPSNKFPKPFDNTDRNQCPEGLMVFLVSTYEGEVWAGWYINDDTTPLPVNDNASHKLLDEMFSKDAAMDGYSGMLEFKEGHLNLNETSLKTPFSILNGDSEDGSSNSEILNLKEFQEEEKEEEEDIEALFDNDVIDSEPEVVEFITKIRRRNTKIVKKLKKLYDHKCQVTGDEFVFKKKNGFNYTEAHHLIPLGDGGFDRPENLVILSPLVHKMFHYADIGDINLEEIRHLEDGSAELDIIINGKMYKIKWAPQHAELFKDN